MRIDSRKANPSLVAWSLGSGAKIADTNKDFKDILKDSIESIKQLHIEDEKNTERLAVGEADSLHNVMIDAEKADIAMQLMLQTRNKAIEAYQEIMRMQI